ncbi:protein of unknown function DUF395, YeeE/YedE [Alkaliphilus metalliredigens QYMF]|uniref:Uncharacterized protein n=1 Tax=Alkaliphilus metalliredigens (strain QYMF) TaxID=293826 RepID=A6TX61_ALKMQ|nr:YeeE/YedE thiosulfate transporter family protein [Alkaliphilus metalliredigens]ABR50779.1 protein of unknown function DUF395, YeeE/YedE [Alkaliphilus metalliredigens QYMF]
MSSSKIEELKKQRTKQLRKRKNQLPYARVVTVVALLVYIVLINYNLKFSSFWIIGILMGVTMQRARFCFTAGFRDPIMVGSTSLLKAVLLAFMVSTIGFFIIQYHAVLMNPDYLLIDIPGQLKPVGVHTAFGGILFGGGMVIAGGCASGTLMRIGEGYMLQLVVLMGFIVGALIGSWHFPFWDRLLISQAPVIYFPSYFGFFPSLIIQLVSLGSLYFIADWYDKKNNIMKMM